MNIYQGNTYRKDFSLSHLNDETRVHVEAREGPTVLHTRFVFANHKTADTQHYRDKKFILNFISLSFSSLLSDYRSKKFFQLSHSFYILQFCVTKISYQYSIKKAIIKLKRTLKTRQEHVSKKHVLLIRLVLCSYFLVVIWIVFDGFVTFSFCFVFFCFFGASETAGGLISPLRRDSFSQKGHLCNYVASLAKPGNCFVIKYSQHSLLAAKSE